MTADTRLHSELIARPGGRDALNTPVLVLDRPAMMRNIEAMAQFAAAQGVKLRPHAKTHKSADIAHLQLAAGAVGQCCAKLGEAEALADAGIDAGLLITSPIVTPPVIARLMALNRRTSGLMCVVDHPDAVRALGMAALDQPLIVLIDIDPGIRRTGVNSPEAAVALAAAIRAEPSLRFGGVQYYCGREQHIADFAERRTAIVARTQYLRSVIDALTSVGAAPEIITGGGTGTHRIDAELSLFTELQVGSYVFMDSQYTDCDLTGNGSTAFEPALFVEATVISANATGLVTLDAGFKAFSTDAGAPRLVAGAPDGASFAFMGDEHGALIVRVGPKPELGARVTLVPPHCDPTVNLYDHYHVVDGDMLVAIWPIHARGRSR